MNIHDIVNSNISAEVIVHAGNIRAIMFGKVSNTEGEGKFIIKENNPTGANSIIFTEKDIAQIVKSSVHHAIIYLAPKI